MIGPRDLVVLIDVVQEVVASVAHLRRRLQDVLVIAVDEHASAPVHDPIHEPRDAYPEALHPLRQRRSSLTTSPAPARSHTAARATSTPPGRSASSRARETASSARIAADEPR